MSPAIYGSPPDEPLGIHPIIRFGVGFYSPHAQCFAILENVMCSPLSGEPFSVTPEAFLYGS